MARANLDPRIVDHLEWLGFIRPTGLVVSAPALVRAGAILDRRDAEGQRLLREQVQQREFNPKVGLEPWLPEFQLFARTVLDWSFSPKGYAGTADNSIPDALEVTLSDFDETLRPDFAVREMEPGEDESQWQLLVRELRPGQEFDRAEAGSGQLEASPHARMERLLRRTNVPAGLLFNGRAVRLLSAPYGENSGWMDFRVADMVQPGGRPICAALRLLLGERRLLALPRSQRLAALLEDSRKFQNEVSERLAEQVLHALYELLRGFQSAHDASKGELLRRQLSEQPDEVYRGLLTVILRLVFLLYAEERDMLPENEVWLRHYSLAGLHERLREDAALFPDTMEQRYGAWSQLVVLFRMIHDGADAGEMRLPKRHGVLFDPDRFPFLEGRTKGGARQIQERVEAPQVPDGTVYRALEKLLVLDGERISYRALDVEQIGSVYETMMGFRLETATGRSIAIKSAKKYGAPTTLDLEALLAVVPAKRPKALQEWADRKPTDKVAKLVRGADSVEDLHAALQPLIDFAASPDLVPAGAIILQPSEERRRSGSHYTPRLLTEPIVRTTLEPILLRLQGDGGFPRPDQILGLKVCDPAMGSGAFLVEACRQLGDLLVKSWREHNALPDLPTDEDEVVFARRLVAQRCLYGVDRNPVAVDLAKVSLWLVTLAKDHPLTFVDHALRHGDSLIGLSRFQIEAFHWDRSKPPVLKGLGLRDALDRGAELRRQIRDAGEAVAEWELRNLWDAAQVELSNVRLIGDLVCAAWFNADSPKSREAVRIEYAGAVTGGTAQTYRGGLEERRHADPPLAPFHWQIEFPEVFDKEAEGFDAIVGNPPFQGGRNLTATQGSAYANWLLELHAGTSGGADLVAHFFRRAFDLLSQNGAFGLIATNTIAQGDTRASGLRWIRSHGGEIYWANKRVQWPGRAAVIVSIIHVVKGRHEGSKTLDGRQVDTITAFLSDRGGDDDPARLAMNSGMSFQGAILLGMGFTFDDTDSKGVATPVAEMNRLLNSDPRNQEVIFPYIGGDEVNSSPTHAHHRFAINFGERTEEECRRRWPELLAIVEERVKPDRITKDAKKYPRMVYEWWKYWNGREELYSAIAGLSRVLVVNCGATPHASFAFLPSKMVFANTLAIVAQDSYAAFCALQSRAHEIWARFFGSSMKDDLRYTPSDCFGTFPFPDKWESHDGLESAGKAYHDFRRTLMVRNNQGLTKTYNRFHDPDERSPEFLHLRNLHAEMDRAMLDVFGWGDIRTACDFILDYEIDEDEWGDKKKPYRYRWPDDVRDELLARLLELNAVRAQEESRAGDRGRITRRKRAGTSKSSTKGLFS